MVKLCRSSAQQKRLCLFTLCIILLVTAVMPARPHQRGVLKASMVFTKDQMEIGSNLETEESKLDNRDCGDDVDEEECLDRRTLVAHTDYIYTQHHKKP
ncbi:hypothetical protein SUGI_0901860 [Cryptomeria japonica]|uniref:phytosulfokines 2 isoform X2 n=1 Tax=Cryptomeria japonica TaxID=3369 RepID=UPI0024149BF9|nr:phytosulfokines 2 isoform X2 [Cryptomeria japonica]GLJ43402.1 hypothetical protein SUGI_0901860 [Cryptomeria japonica]